jgi:hypothetical protein
MTPKPLPQLLPTPKQNGKREGEEEERDNKIRELHRLIQGDQMDKVFPPILCRTYFAQYTCICSSAMHIQHGTTANRPRPPPSICTRDSLRTYVTRAMLLCLYGDMRSDCNKKTVACRVHVDSIKCKLDVGNKTLTGLYFVIFTQLQIRKKL